MTNAAPGNESGDERRDDEARQDRPAGPPEGFEPPTQGGAGQAGPGVTAWPTLGQEAAMRQPHPDDPGAHPYGYDYQGYELGPGSGTGHAPPPRPRRLYRSETDRVVAGVCGGLRDYLGVDANLLRVVFVLLAIFAGGSGLLIYVVLWALVPRRSRLGISPSETAMDAVNEVRDRFQGLRRA